MILEKMNGSLAAHSFYFLVIYDKFSQNLATANELIASLKSSNL